MSKNSNEVKRLSDNETRRLFRLLQTSPNQQQLDEFLTSLPQEETKTTSISRRIQNSQLSAALSWMDSSTLRSTHGKH